VRLFFLGVQHPNPNVPEMRMVVEARRLATELGINGTHVFFNESWVAYDDRQNYLLEADIGVSTHYDHVETAFSFRTRILDYLWVGLPIVTTGGDSFADLIASRPLGLTVPAEDVHALEHALFTLLDDAELRARCTANSVAVADELRWSKVLDPLVQFCREPRRAPDLLESVPLPGSGPARPSWRDRGGLGQDLRIVKALVTEGGLTLVARKALGRARRMVGPR
jgi:glycosyltransferase involved in cell wall biosynthesis